MMSFQFLLYLFQSCYHQDGFHLQKASELPLARLGFSGMPAPFIMSGVGWSLGRSFPVPLFLQSYVSTLWCRGSITMPGSSTSPSAQLAVQYTETPSAKEMWREKQTCATWKPVQHTGDSGDPFQPCFYVSLYWSQQPGCEPEEEGNGWFD